MQQRLQDMYLASGPGELGGWGAAADSTGTTELLVLRLE